MNTASTNKIKIIIPCYNEAKRLNVSKFLFFCKSNSTISFLFVDDGSTDETLALIHKMADELPSQISFIHLEKNQGKAEAVRQGFLHSFKSQEEYIGYWDADLATPLSDIREFLKILVKYPHINLVIGSRVKLLGRNIHRNLVRHYCGRVFATFVSLLLEIPIYDTQCGAKVFRKNPYLYNAFQKKFQSRWIFDVEILSRILDFADSKDCIYEVPLQKWTDVTGSKLKFKDFLVSGYELLRLFISYKARNHKFAPKKSSLLPETQQSFYFNDNKIHKFPSYYFWIFNFALAFSFCLMLFLNLSWVHQINISTDLIFCSDCIQIEDIHQSRIKTYISANITKSDLNKKIEFKSVDLILCAQNKFYKVPAKLIKSTNNDENKSYRVESSFFNFVVPQKNYKVIYLLDDGKNKSIVRMDEKNEIKNSIF